ncbi:MAG: MurR/RpiR family transcriptional regulator [Oscillospiraceae bacterium]|nr:MurR/RpiR family transcriptional regulator [Oscillospiraceae bacterium]
MEDLVHKIQSMTLTRTDAEIAEYILAHLSTIGFQTSTTMAEEIGVSDTSVIRFIRKLGFKGYADFRSEMNARTARQIDRAQPDLNPGEKYLRTLEHLGSDSLISDVSQYTLNNLRKSYAQLDQGTVEQVVDILLRSDRKYIAGFRGTACCAQYMASKLLFLTPHVVPILHADASAVENLLDITDRDCLFLYSFPRYSEIARPLLEIARESGAKVILMTDRRTSPLANKADVVLTAQVDGLGFTNSYVAPLSLSEVILLSVSGRKDMTDSKRFNRIDSVMEREKLY